MTVFSGIKVPKIIFEADSKYNGHIEVLEIDNIRKVKVDKFEQSISPNAESSRRLVWGKMVDILREEEPELKEALLFGLGGGTVAHLLAETYPNINLVSVDIDPVMIDIAKRFFYVDQIPNHKIILGDALRVVIEPQTFGLTPQTFQVVYIDIFIGEKYPELGNSGNFMGGVKSFVRPGGLLMFNRIYLPHHQDDVNSFIENLSGFLRDVKCVIVAGHTNSDNILIYGRV